MTGAPPGVGNTLVLVIVLFDVAVKDSALAETEAAPVSNKATINIFMLVSSGWEHVIGSLAEG
jgi:hypothetical protein